MSSKLRIILVAALLAIPATAFAAHKLSSCGCDVCACGSNCNCGK